MRSRVSVRIKSNSGKLSEDSGGKWCFLYTVGMSATDFSWGYYGVLEVILQGSLQSCCHAFHSGSTVWGQRWWLVHHFGQHVDVSFLRLWMLWGCLGWHASAASHWSWVQCLSSLRRDWIEPVFFHIKSSQTRWFRPFTMPSGCLLSRIFRAGYLGHVLLGVGLEGPRTPWERLGNALVPTQKSWMM